MRKRQLLIREAGSFCYFFLFCTLCVLCHSYALLCKPLRSCPLATLLSSDQLEGEGASSSLPLVALLLATTSTTESRLCTHRRNSTSAFGTSSTAHLSTSRCHQRGFAIRVLRSATMRLHLLASLSLLPILASALPSPFAPSFALQPDTSNTYKQGGAPVAYDASTSLAPQKVPGKCTSQS